jgi:hypothetical protein
MEPEPEHGAATISLASYVRLIGVNRNFRRLWLAQIVSEIGDWFYTLSIYQKHGEHNHEANQVGGDHHVLAVEIDGVAGLSPASGDRGQNVPRPWVRH